MFIFSTVVLVFFVCVLKVWIDCILYECVRVILIGSVSVGRGRHGPQSVVWPLYFPNEIFGECYWTSGMKIYWLYVSFMSESAYLYQLNFLQWLAPPPCPRHTATAYTALSIASRSKNVWKLVDICGRYSQPKHHRFRDTVYTASDISTPPTPPNQSLFDAGVLTQQHLCQKLPISVDMGWSYIVQHQCRFSRQSVGLQTIDLQLRLTTRRA